MFQKILFSLLLASMSLTATAESGDAYKNFVSTLDQALSFNEVIDHQMLDINEEIKKRKAENKPMQCKGLPGDQALEVLEKEVLYVDTDWLTTPERDTFNTWFQPDQKFYVCRDEALPPKSADFYQASLVFLINTATNEGLAFRVDWIDGDVIDEP